MRKSVILIALAIGGCATQPIAWMKADGGATTPEQRELAMTICQGEVENAAVQGQAHSAVAMDQQDAGIYDGCMTRLGYVAVSGR